MVNQTAQELDLPEALVKSIVDFQYQWIKQEAGKNENVTIEFSEILTLHWKTARSKTYIKHLYYVLGALHQNLEIPERDRKMQEVREKIKTFDDKNTKYSKWSLALGDRAKQVCQGEEDDMPE